MGSNVFIFGFTDELVKLAQAGKFDDRTFGPTADIIGDVSNYKIKTPKPVTPLKTGPHYSAKPKPKGFNAPGAMAQRMHTGKNPATPAQKRPSGYFGPEATTKRMQKEKDLKTVSGFIGRKPDKFWRETFPKQHKKKLSLAPTGPEAGPRPAPGTRLPPQMKHMPAGPKKFTPPKKKGPTAEGMIPEMSFKGMRLPSGGRVKPQNIVSEVASRKRWEAANKPKLPGWLSDSMKRPVKGNPMASAEGAARAKREESEAKSLVSKFTQGGKQKRRIKRFAAKDYGPSREDMWNLVAGKGGRTERGGGSVRSTGVMAPHRTSLRRIPAQQPTSIANRPAPPPKPQSTSVPGYRAVAKKKTI